MIGIKEHFRTLLTAVVLSCYLMGASFIPLIEGLHFVSHYISDAHVDQGVHSFFNHGTQHSHHNLDLIESLMNHDSDSPNTILEIELDKKNQICLDQWPSNSSDILRALNCSYLIYTYNSRTIHIPTPPPEV